MAFFYEQTTDLLQFSQADVVELLGAFDRTLENVMDDILVIKDWFVMQDHLPKTLGDRQILFFLLANKFYIEITKQKIDMYYSVKDMTPEFFHDRLPSSEQLQAFHQSMTMVPLPLLSPQKTRVTAFKILKEDDPSYNSTNIASYYFMNLEFRLLSDLGCSEEVIIDCNHITVAMVARYSFMDIKKLVTILERVYSNRIAAVHVSNLPSCAEILLKFFLSLLKDKLRKRIHVHKGIEFATKIYPKSMLPSDFGGELKSMQELGDDWMKLLLANEAHYKMLEKLKVDESKRKNKLENDDVLGYQGNFKKLEVD